MTDNAQSLYDAVNRQVTELDAGGTKERRDALSRVIDDLIEDNLQAGSAEADQRMRELQADPDVRSALGRSRGIFAAIANSIGSGHLYATIGAALFSVLRSQRLAAALMILGALLIQLLVWVFLRNVYGAVLRRAFLETRTYAAYPLSHLFHIHNVRRWRRASATMLLASVYQSLWSLTLVGGVIKHYSYFLVPFIVAENPDIRPKEAIALSRRMMDGHKWACFVLDVSYLGWRLLGFATFGVVQVLWTVPYRVAGYAEFYAALRVEALRAGVPGAEQLNDDCLYAKADPDRLRDAYPEIARHEELLDEDIVELPPRQRFFARNFGVWTAGMEEKIVYSRQAGLRQQTRIDRQELRGEAYPKRLCPLWTKGSRALTGRVSYLPPARCGRWSSCSSPSASWGGCGRSACT